MIFEFALALLLGGGLSWIYFAGGPGALHILLQWGALHIPGVIQYALPIIPAFTMNAFTVCTSIFPILYGLVQLVWSNWSTTKEITYWVACLMFFNRLTEIPPELVHIYGGPFLFCVICWIFFSIHNLSILKLKWGLPFIMALQLYELLTQALASFYKIELDWWWREKEPVFMGTALVFTALQNLPPRDLLYFTLMIVDIVWIGHFIFLDQKNKHYQRIEGSTYNPLVVAITKIPSQAKKIFGKMIRVADTKHSTFNFATEGVWEEETSGNNRDLGTFDSSFTFFTFFRKVIAVRITYLPFSICVLKFWSFRTENPALDYVHVILKWLCTFSCILTKDRDPNVLYDTLIALTYADAQKIVKTNPGYFEVVSSLNCALNPWTCAVIPQDNATLLYRTNFLIMGLILSPFIYRAIDIAWSTYNGWLKGQGFVIPVDFIFDEAKRIYIQKNIINSGELSWLCPVTFGDRLNLFIIHVYFSVAIFHLEVTCYLPIRIILWFWVYKMIEHENECRFVTNFQNESCVAQVHRNVRYKHNSTDRTHAGRVTAFMVANGKHLVFDGSVSTEDQIAVARSEHARNRNWLNFGSFFQGLFKHYGYPAYGAVVVAIVGLIFKQ